LHDVNNKEYRNAIYGGSIMPIIEGLIQGSDKWLQYRQSRIMATDAPVILGSNPWKTKLELFEEKLGLRPPPSLNPAMERGTLLEPAARQLASELISVDFRPVVVESTKHPWLASSLDGLGWCKNQYILEIKCPKASTHDDALDDRIPEYYRDQIQTQLLCSEAGICYYFSYRPERKDKPYAIIEVYPDLEKQAEIIEKGYEFYKQMCQMEPPEEWKLNKKG